MSRLDSVASEWHNPTWWPVDPLVPAIAPAIVMNQDIFSINRYDLSLVPLIHGVFDVDPGANFEFSIVKAEWLCR